MKKLFFVNNAKTLFQFYSFASLFWWNREIVVRIVAAKAKWNFIINLATTGTFIAYLFVCLFEKWKEVHTIVLS
jgi:hypothetical protein